MADQSLAAAVFSVGGWFARTRPAGGRLTLSVYHGFLDENRERYRQLDERFEGLTSSETLVGGARHPGG